MEVKHTSPLLPLRDIIVFPSMVIPLFVGRDKSITALNEVMKNNKKTGARGLRSILENILLKTMFDLPGREDIDEVIIDAGAAKGQNDPIVIHGKEAKSKTEKTSAA